MNKLKPLLYVWVPLYHSKETDWLKGSFKLGNNLLFLKAFVFLLVTKKLSDRNTMLRSAPKRDRIVLDLIPRPHRITLTDHAMQVWSDSTARWRPLPNWKILGLLIIMTPGTNVSVARHSSFPPERRGFCEQPARSVPRSPVLLPLWLGSSSREQVTRRCVKSGGHRSGGRKCPSLLLHRD